MSTNPSPNLDDFLAGRPLSKENAALMEGREPVQEFDHQGEAAEPGQEHRGPLSDDEKTWLRRLVNEPGFPVLIRLLNTTFQNHEDVVRLLSTTDPLKNKDQVINEWAYLACFKKLLFQIQLIVKNAIV